MEIYGARRAGRGTPAAGGPLGPNAHISDEGATFPFPQQTLSTTPVRLIPGAGFSRLGPLLAPGWEGGNGWRQEAA